MDNLKQCYAFNIIVLQSSLPVVEGEESPYNYRVRLYNEFLELSPDRVVTEYFPNNPISTFVASPCDLVGSLSSKGICVTVYENGNLFGCGTCRPSTGLLRMLADPTFSCTESLNITLEKGKRRMGHLHLKINISSVDPDLDARLLPFGCYDVCRPQDKSVNPRDIIFTLGRSRKCAGTTCITDERLMSQAGAPFNCTHNENPPAGKECSCGVRGAKTPPAMDPTKERERKMLKKLLVDLQIDRERVPTPPSGHERSRQCQCVRYDASSDSSSSYDSSDSSLYQDRNIEKDKPEFDAPLSPQQLEELQEVRRRALGACPIIRAPELTTAKYTPPLLCSVCHANITWLPKFAACPYCGYKRCDLEQPSEEPFDETATAADVLRDHMLHTRVSSESSQRSRFTCSNVDPASCSATKITKTCTCKGGRVCTRCRIQQLCDNMVDTKPKSPESKSPARPLSPKKTPSTPSQHREHLLKIFSDMQKVVGGKPSAKEVADNVLKQCAEITRKGKKGRQRSASIKKLLREMEECVPTKRKKKSKCVTRKSKRRKSKRYTFLVRKDTIRQPNTHHTCSQGSGRVPCHMGWMWTKSELAAHHKSWKPGAIKKSIRELMAYFLKDYPADKIVNSRFHYRTRKEPDKCAVEEPLIQHPTLHIVKKHDEYTITLRPLKDAKTLAVAANPYANMKPVVFRISKDPIATGKRNIKLGLNDRGYDVCTCHQPVSRCFCRSHIDQKLLVEDVKILSAEQGWQDVSDTFVYSDLSESDSDNELEFGVTPPAGIVKPERCNRPDRVNCETQYNENDWAMPTMYPHPPNAQVQYGGCVIGERKDRFPWIFGKGFVHQEPKPPKMINRRKTDKPKAADKSKGRLKGGADTAIFRGGFDPYSGKPTWLKAN
ncbi:uncharacterized protein LOC6572780 [Drosophila mojavensis]|uniref:Uncharacterized protein n=1 Tax=Drosophila mojavensis TaxID=7230 RepID=B4K813_DROMO|nr:uncharacterized protein LOC6572780 [Drosophila mojavensis]EDW14347.1 uncharacterized protein Dmoj_GI23385 [Drosophila mojavensis]